MKKTKIVRLIWQCNYCKDVVVSYSHLRHDMNWCECGKSAIDLEDRYTRGLGSTKGLSRKENINGKWVNIKQ